MSQPDYDVVVVGGGINGVGVAQAAAAAVCRNSIGVEKDASLKNFGTQINFVVHSFLCTGLLGGSKRLWFLLLGILV